MPLTWVVLWLASCLATGWLGAQYDAALPCLAAWFLGHAACLAKVKMIGMPF